MRLQEIITTGRLVLRPFRPSDTEDVFRFASDPENARYMIYLPVRTREGTRQFLQEAWDEWQKEEPSFYEYAVLKKQEGQDPAALCPVIGEISLWLHGEDAELGWILDRSEWGQGYMTEAARALIDEARANLQAVWFTAHCDDANAASYRLMEKLGMEMAGRYGGRKNRLSEEERMERFYRMPFRVS